MVDSSASSPSDPSSTFFGAVTAGLSHELNNVFATIRELSGLLDDLAAAGERGRLPEPARLQSIAQRIAAQVERGQCQTKCLSRFAHSVDRPSGAADVGGVAQEVLALAARVARLKKVELRSAIPEYPLPTPVSAFDLYHVLWRCLEAGFAAVEPGGWVELAVDSSGSWARIRVSGSSAASASPSPETVLAVLSGLVPGIGGELRSEPGWPATSPLTVVLPKPPTREGAAAWPGARDRNAR